MNHVIALGTALDPHALKLETRRRNWIKNVVRPEIHPDLMRTQMVELQRLFPFLTPISASAIYNCYGLAFAARRSAIVDEDDILAILNDDEYRVLPWHPAGWEIGDVVIYKDSVGAVKHVGVIARKTPDIASGTIQVDVLSAWGSNGEYLHPIDRVSPLLGVPAEVRSQRFLR